MKYFKGKKTFFTSLITTTAATLLHTEKASNSTEIF